MSDLTKIEFYCYHITLVNIMHPTTIITMVFCNAVLLYDILHGELN